MVLLENGTPGWPDITDDIGDLTSGTSLEKAIIEAWRETVDDQTHSAANPTIKPKTITDEVVDARGNEANLNARISGVVDDDGVFLIPPYLVTGDGVAECAAGFQNHLFNDQFLLWHLGDTSAPSGWTLSGAGAAIQRCGTGLADTTRLGIGDFCARLTYGAAEASLKQSVVPSGTIATRLSALLADSNVFGNGISLADRTRKIGVGCLVKASTANQAVVRLSLAGGGSFDSNAHPGDGATYFMGILGGDGAATELACTLRLVAAGADVYFSAPMLIMVGDVSVAEGQQMFPWFASPARMVRREHVIHFPGNITTGTRKWAWNPRRPGIITDVFLSAGTAPTGQAAIYDLNTWDGAALTSMFATRPQIADGATEGHAQPDTTYARRCFYPVFTAAKAAGSLVTLDCDQIGSGAAGADATVTIGYLEYVRPLEGFYDYNTE